MDLKEQLNAARERRDACQSALRAAEKAAEAVFMEATKAEREAFEEAEMALRVAARAFAESIAPCRVGDRFDTSVAGRWDWVWSGATVQVVRISASKWEWEWDDEPAITVARVRKDGTVGAQQVTVGAAAISRWRKAEG